MKGDTRRRQERSTGMFYFLIQVVVTQVFSFCETSLGAKFMIHALSVYMLFFQKSSVYLSLKHWFLQVSTRHWADWDHVASADRGNGAPGSAHSASAIRGLQWGQQHPRSQKQDTGRCYMSWMYHTVEPTIQTPLRKIPRKYLGRAWNTMTFMTFLYSGVVAHRKKDQF